MQTGLGVTVGSANSVAVTVSGPTDRRAPVVLCRATELHPTADPAPLLGHRPEARTRPLTDFTARIGDPVGMLTDDGACYLSEDLTATAVACLLHEAGGTTATIAHPAVWPEHTVDALRAALDRAAIRADLVPEPVAAVRWLEATHGPLGESVTVVVDPGARSLDVAVVQGGTRPQLLGRPVSDDEVCGDLLDHLVTGHVLDTAREAVSALDPHAPATVAALKELRRRCRAAKEALSSETETVVALDLPGVRRDVRLVRDEFEELAREPLGSLPEVVREAVRLAGIEVGDVDRVLLVGGGASVPLVTELLSSQLGLPVTTSPHPAATAAHGAALLAADAALVTAGSTGHRSDTEPHSDTDTDTDTDVLGTVVPAAVSATRRPAVVDPAPSRPGRSRRVAVVTAAAAAVALLAGGGLTLGTLSSPGDADRPGPAGDRADRPSASVTPGGETGGVTVADTPDGRFPATVVPAGATHPADAAPAAPGTPFAPGADPSAPGADPSAPADTAPGAETDPGPGPTDTAPPGVPAAPAPTAAVPAPAPPPAPAPAPQPDGSAAGNVLQGAGQGAGAVVEGAGNGVGGVLGGAGNAVGGVLGGAGDAVGGLLGN